jgi:DNA-directed RNA polymerase specialized sigma subunit
MPNDNKPAGQSKGMPSILGDISPPFSAPASVTGVANEFNNLHTSWKNNQTPETNTQILKSVQPVVDTALTMYAGVDHSPSIRSQAKLLALKALNSYSPERGNVRNHLLSQLQSLRRMSAKEQNIISIPEQVGLDFQRISQAENELQDSLGREPTEGELADYTNLSRRRIQKIKSFNQPLAEGVVSSPTEEGTSGGDIGSKIPGDRRADDAWLDFVYGDLGPTDKLIMDMTLGRNGKRKAATQDIARRLNITPGAVSQRAAKIQEMLDKRYTYGGFRSSNAKRHDKRQDRR